MSKWKKYMCIGMAGIMMTSMLAGCMEPVEGEKSGELKQTPPASGTARLERTILSQAGIDESAATDKEETVYVKADALGNTEDITVSTWLKNPEGAEKLDDKTELSDVENVKGYETFTNNADGSITWQAGGNDIYYTGKSDKELPVSVKLSYKLDGKDIEPEALAGKSGRVTIRFDYTNNTRTTAGVKEGSREVLSPFVMLSGMLLPADTFTNVEVTNGKVISEGSNQIVVGMAVPGFKECLCDGLNDDELSNAINNLDVPDYVEVTADVTDFELSMTMTVATGNLLDSEASPAEKVDGLNEDINGIKSDADKLRTSADSLCEGAGKVTDGLTTFSAGTGSLKTGADTLADGSCSMKKYTGQLAQGTGQLATAVDSLDKGIGSVKSGSLALKDGAATLSKGVKKLDGSVASLKTGTVSLDNGANALLTGFEGVRGDATQIGLVKGADNLETGLTNAYESSKALLNGATEIKNGMDTLVSLLTGMPDTVVSEAKGEVYEQLAAFGISDENGIGETMAQIEGALAMGADALGGMDVYNSYLEKYRALAKVQGALDAINSIGESLTAAVGSMSDDNNPQSIKKLTDGAAALETGLSALSTGLGTISSGATALSNGIDTAYAGVKALKTGTGELVTGVDTLKVGTKNLSDGAKTLSVNMNTLYLGSVDLATGSGQLKTATTTLNSSASQIADGAAALSDGAAQLKNGAASLDAGAEELLSGAATLRDGMQQFNEEGIKKLTDMFSQNYEDDINFIEAFFSDDVKYTNYGGFLTGSTTSVKFIYETGAIR